MPSDHAITREKYRPMLSVIDVVGISLLMFISFHFANVGFVGSDDAAYIGAARQWVHAIPPVSNFFGDLRYTVILPIAASIMLFGDSEAAAEVPALLYAFATILVTYFGMRSLTDRATAVILAALLAISPLLSGLSTTPGDDVCELFFDIVSFITFFLAVREKSWGLFFVAGIAAGLGFMSRESTIELLAVYGILFLIGFGGRRYVYWIMAAGFAAVFFTEIAYYALVAGDPLHRIYLVAAAAGKPDPVDAVGAIDLSSNRVFNISLVFDPILYAFTHPQLALAIPLALIVCILVWLKKPALASGQKTFFLCWCLFGVFSFLMSAYVLCYLNLLPRYFLFPFYCALVAIAIWLRAGLWSAHKSASIAVTVVLVSASILGTAIANRSPLYAERVLASAATKSSATIHTDPETKFRGNDLFRWAGVNDRISSAPPVPGDLFFYNPKFASLRTPRNKGADLTRYNPQSGWVAEDTFAEQPSSLARILTMSGIAGRLPDAIARRIVTPNPAVVLYRIAN
jgi:4-amino-4-deoxy-L-arabinose transferase-like glycosyltransferase